jgi:hypothetical protein
VLRRLGLFRQADRLTVDAIGVHGLRIDWTGGQSPAYVMAMLTDPLTGLLDEDATVVTAAVSPDDMDKAAALGSRSRLGW